MNPSEIYVKDYVGFVKKSFKSYHIKTGADPLMDLLLFIY